VKLLCSLDWLVFRDYAVIAAMSDSMQLSPLPAGNHSPRSARPNHRLQMKRRIRDERNSFWFLRRRNTEPSELVFYSSRLRVSLSFCSLSLFLSIIKMIIDSQCATDVTTFSSKGSFLFFFFFFSIRLSTPDTKPGRPPIEGPIDPWKIGRR